MPEPTTDDPGDGAEVTVLVPGGDPEGDANVSATDRAAESMEHVVVTSAQGHAFTMEQGRLGMLEGKVGYREGLTHRIIGESGGGQARAQLPGGSGGVPTA